MRNRYASEEILRGIGMRLAWLREAFGHSQVTWAKQLGVTNQVINKWESGQRQPNLDTMVVIVNACRASMDYLILGKLTEEMDPELRRYLLRHHRAHLSGSGRRQGPGDDRAPPPMPPTRARRTRQTDHQTQETGVAA